MTTVKVLIDAVGPFNAEDIVKDAPPGLVEMAIQGTVNAATGERIAEVIEDEATESDELKALRKTAKDLKIKQYTKMNEEQLSAAIAEAEAYKALLDKAEELSIKDADKLTPEELTAAIEAAGGGKVGE